jgi:hypothetical protein
LTNGVILDLNVRLIHFSHTFPGDVDILLVGHAANEWRSG